MMIGIQHPSRLISSLSRLSVSDSLLIIRSRKVLETIPSHPPTGISMLRFIFQSIFQLFCLPSAACSVHGVIISMLETCIARISGISTATADSMIIVCRFCLLVPPAVLLVLFTCHLLSSLRPHLLSILPST